MSALDERSLDMSLGLPEVPPLTLPLAELSVRLELDEPPALPEPLPKVDEPVALPAEPGDVLPVPPEVEPLWALRVTSEEEEDLVLSASLVLRWHAESDNAQAPPVLTIFYRYVAERRQ